MSIAFQCHTFSSSNDGLINSPADTIWEITGSMSESMTAVTVLCTVLGEGLEQNFHGDKFFMMKI